MAHSNLGQAHCIITAIGRNKQHRPSILVVEEESPAGQARPGLYPGSGLGLVVTIQEEDST